MAVFSIICVSYDNDLVEGYTVEAPDPSFHGTLRPFWGKPKKKSDSPQKLQQNISPKAGTESLSAGIQYRVFNGMYCGLLS